MDGTAETAVHRRSGSEVCDALSVIKLPADRNHAATHVLATLFTHEAGVDA